MATFSTGKALSLVDVVAVGELRSPFQVALTCEHQAGSYADWHQAQAVIPDSVGQLLWDLVAWRVWVYARPKEQLCPIDVSDACDDGLIHELLPDGGLTRGQFLDEPFAFTSPSVRPKGIRTKPSLNTPDTLLVNNLTCRRAPQVCSQAWNLEPCPNLPHNIRCFAFCKSPLPIDS